MNALAQLQPVRDTLQTLLLHQKLTDETQIFLQALRSGDTRHAWSMMSKSWDGMNCSDFSSMISERLPAFGRSTATFLGLVMDDGCEAVVDAFLYFENERWASCDVTLALEESHWKIDSLALREIDWELDPFSDSDPKLTSRTHSLDIEG